MTYFSNLKTSNAEETNRLQKYFRTLTLFCLRKAERRRSNVFEMKCLRPMVGCTRWDRIRNEENRRRAGIEKTLAEKVDRRVLRWFGLVERMDEGRWPRKVKAPKVEDRQERKVLAIRKVGLQEATQLSRETSV